jgi:aminomethyltransferase
MARRTPLHDLLAQAGATFAERDGWLVAAYYDGVEDEWTDAHEGIAVGDRSARGFLRVHGPDARRLLQGLVTNDVDGLAPGQAVYALVLTPKGRPVSDLRLACTAEDAFLLECEPGAHDALAASLRRYRLASRAEIEDARGEVAGAALLGRADVPAVPGLVMLPSVLGTDVAGPPEQVRQVWEAYPGATPIGADTYELLRVEGGVPRAGAELTEDVLPAEAGVVDRAVSFSKGCYVGQEPVARLHFRGHPNRTLRRLVLAGVGAPGLPAAIIAGEREVGRVTSLATPPEGPALALGYVRREVEDGAEVRLRGPDGELYEAAVEPLPAPARR